MVRGAMTRRKRPRRNSTECEPSGIKARDWFVARSLRATCLNVLPFIQDQEAEDLSLKLEDLKKNEKGRARRIKTLETEIAKMKDELENPPKIESMDAVNDDQVSIHFSYLGPF